MKAKKYCIHEKCHKVATSAAFCRLHYLVNWKRLKLSKQIQGEQRLNQYVEHVMKKHPADYVEKIKENIDNEQSFQEAVNDVFSIEGPDTDYEFLEGFKRKLKVGNE